MFQKVGKQMRSPVFFIMAIAIIICSFLAGCIIPDVGSEPGNDTHSREVRDTIIIKDSDGDVASFSHPVQRIVVLNAGAAEILINIGAGDLIVGTGDNMMLDRNAFMKPYLSHAKAVGSFTTPDIEAIASINPDVVISYTGSKPLNAEQIHGVNITLIKLTCYKPREVPGDARMLGKLTGHEEGAERYARFIEKYLDLLDTRLENISSEDRPRIYYEWTREYRVFGPGGGAHEMIKLVRGTNVAGDFVTLNAIVSPDWVLEQDPDVIFKDGTSGSGNFSLVRQEVLDRPGFQPLKAVREGQVYCMQPQLISTPRSVIGALYAAKALYPDRFSDIDPDEILREYAREFLPGTDQIQTFYPPLTSVSPLNATRGAGSGS
jgi:iron complex transport system substrate-binding protein